MFNPPKINRSFVLVLFDFIRVVLPNAAYSTIKMHQEADHQGASCLSWVWPAFGSQTIEDGT